MTDPRVRVGDRREHVESRIRPGGRSSDVHDWSMEDDLGGATLRFTALYDSNLADPLA